MDAFPKFIIETYAEEGDCLILSKCTWHRQLVANAAMVKGGGWWILDKEKSVFTLHGSIDEFGMAKVEDIAGCVQRSKVYSNPSLCRNYISDGFGFMYKYESGEIIDLKSYGINKIIL